MHTRLGPACGRRIRGHYTYCTISRMRTPHGAYAPACARCLTRAERDALGLVGGLASGRPNRAREYVDIAKIRAGDRD